MLVDTCLAPGDVHRGLMSSFKLAFSTDNATSPGEGGFSHAEGAEIALDRRGSFRLWWKVDSRDHMEGVSFSRINFIS